MTATKTTGKLMKIEAGRYVSEDGRFEIVDTYDPSGAPWARSGRTSNRWLMTDNTQTGSRSMMRFFTLADCRWYLTLIQK